LTFPDSVLPLYLAFLAWDKFVATHDKDGLGGAPRVPGETEYEADTEKVTGIAKKIMDDLLDQAGIFLEEDEYTPLKSQLNEYVQEL
jgi:amyloid beta precursor protein binding protein 1